MKSTVFWVCTVAAAPLGCQGTHETPETQADAGSEPSALEHTFPAVSVGPYGETDDVCQSWTLGNEEPLYVHTVSMENAGGLHHSNWFYVPEDVFDGPDGTWSCDDRDWNELTAAASGGVLFAQSTQAREESQRFPEGAVFVIPPHSKVVGNLHILNASESPLETTIDLTIDAVPEEQAEVFLSPMVFSYQGLDIPPKRNSSFEGSCDFTEAYGAPIDFDLYYILPHYHALGTGALLETDGMEGGDEMIFEKSGIIGDVLSKTLDPPFDATSSSGFHFGCEFTNPRDETVGFGIGDQEMCIILAWQDSGYMFYANVDQTEEVSTEGSVEVHEGSCEVLFLSDQ